MVPVLLIVSIAFLIAPFIYLFLKSSHFPDLPGPPLTDYLPNGVAYTIFKDRSQYLNTLIKLSKQYGEIFQVRVAMKRYVVTSVPGDIVHVLTNFDDFERMEGIVAAFETIAPGGIFTMPRELHRQTRLKMRENFNHTMLPAFHVPMLAAVDELITDLTTVANKSTPGQALPMFDANEMLSTVTFRVILNVAFGAELSYKERIDFARKVHDLSTGMAKEVILYPIIQSLSWLGIRDSFLACRDDISAVARRLVEKRLAESKTEKESRSQDFLDAIMDAGIENLETITSNTVFAVLAGSHTVNVTLSWCLFYLSQHPRIQRKIDNEIDSLVGGSDRALTHDDISKFVYLKKVWKETLRLCPPIGLAKRRALRDVTLKGSGVKLSKGTRVTSFSKRAHTHEKYWMDAESFIPERWGTTDEPGEGDQVCAGAYVPYSAGIRSCLGQFLAEYEGMLVLTELLRRFRFSLACEPSEVVSTYAVAVVGRYSSKKDGILDMGIPFHVQLR